MSSRFEVGDSEVKEAPAHTQAQAVELQMHSVLQAGEIHHTVIKPPPFDTFGLCITSRMLNHSCHTHTQIV